MLKVSPINQSTLLKSKEMKTVVSGLYTMVGMEVDAWIVTMITINFWAQVPDDVLNERTKEILEIVDIDGDGEISKEEFVNKAMACEFISSMLEMIDDDVWNINQNYWT